MNSSFVEMFGPSFLVDDVRELELLTDLLDIAGDHLDLVFAVASYLEQVPNGSAKLKPVLQRRLGQSLQRLGLPEAAGDRRLEGDGCQTQG